VQKGGRYICPAQQHNEGRNELRYEGFTSL
jgi:hypothetical protein